MVIRASSGRQVDALIADLTSTSALTREGAAARLTVIGERAVPRLLAVVGAVETGIDTRVSALQALEGIGDLRALEPAMALIESGDLPVALAAAGTLQAFLRSPRGVEPLDRLTAVAVDRGRPRELRLASIRGLRQLGTTTIAPLLEALGSDPDQAIAMAAGLGPDAVVDPARLLHDAAEGGLPDDPAGLRVALTEAAGTVPLPVLQQLVERVRFREGAETGSVRAEWTTLRGAAHAALAHRGSRLALFDLKESLESAREPLPVEFLGAVAAVGDSSCLEPLAAAYSRAIDAGVRVDDWWLQRLTDVFRTIAQREHITRRTAAGRKVVARWREAAGVLFA